MESFRKLLESISPEQDPEAEVSLSSKKSLLIVDDNPDVIASLSVILNKKYELILCSNFEEIQKKINPDIKVALLDIKMANKDGIEVFSFLKSQNPDIKIIFHSAYPGSEEIGKKAHSLPHFGYLTKGAYSITELLAKIESAF